MVCGRCFIFLGFTNKIPHFPLQHFKRINKPFPDYDNCINNKLVVFYMGLFNLSTRYHLGFTSIHTHTHTHTRTRTHAHTHTTHTVQMPNTQTHTCTHTHTMYRCQTHTHYTDGQTHTHTHTYADTHAHTCTRTHTHNDVTNFNMIILSFQCSKPGLIE